MAVRPSGWSLARQIFVLQVLVIGLVVLAALAATYVQARRDTMGDAAQRVLDVARSIAASPTVVGAVGTEDPSAVLQPYAEQVRRNTGTDFVVVMGTDRERYSHPNADLIGEQFIGTIEPALDGDAFTETFTGTLGPSVRAVVPVRDGGEVTALVSVGITTAAVGREVRAQSLLLLGGAAVALALAGLGALLISRRLRRQTHGLGQAQLRRMYEYYDAVLHAVREGLLLLDRKGGVQLANDEAHRLLGLPGDVEPGTQVVHLGLPAPLADALAQGTSRADEIHLTDDRVLVVNQAPAVWEGVALGTVVTLRDHTDLLALTGELDSARALSEALRSQAHEAANRLHTVVSLIELGRSDEAVEFATTGLRVAQELTDRVLTAVAEPVLAALLLGKAAEASERGVELAVAAGTAVPEGLVAARDLVTIVGNLLDNALDAAAAGDPPRRVEIEAALDGPTLVLRVADSGPGLDAADVGRAFVRGWSTKSDERLHGRGLGLALVGQTVHRYDGTIEVGRDVGAVFTVRIPVDAPAGVPR